MLERNRNKEAAATIEEISAQYDRIALVFQGGGALGAYQAGVYQALADAGCEPSWLSGVSIGAINASIIAGNEPSRRLQRLEQFWQTISGRKIWAYTPEGDIYRDIRNRTSSWMTMTMGQPGFFKPRNPNPWFEQQGAEGATSFYDTAELKETLESLIDFDVLNDGKKRLSVGAVNVRTGNFVYFDTEKVRIGPEHIMASGACRRPFLRSASKANIIGTAVSSPTHRCNICSTRKRTVPRWYSRSTCSARVACCRAACRTCCPATRTSCIQAARARTPTISNASMA
ncbi:patatin-like phospholipase family protein [Mesorhizobium sp. ORM6]